MAKAKKEHVDTQEVAKQTELKPTKRFSSKEFPLDYKIILKKVVLLVIPAKSITIENTKDLNRSLIDMIKERIKNDTTNTFHLINPVIYDLDGLMRGAEMVIASQELGKNVAILNIASNPTSGIVSTFLQANDLEVINITEIISESIEDVTDKSDEYAINSTIVLKNLKIRWSESSKYNAVEAFYEKLTDYVMQDISSFADSKPRLALDGEHNIVVQMSQEIDYIDSPIINNRINAVMDKLTAEQFQKDLVKSKENLVKQHEKEKQKLADDIKQIEASYKSKMLIQADEEAQLLKRKDDLIKAIKHLADNLELKKQEVYNKTVVEYLDHNPTTTNDISLDTSELI